MSFPGETAETVAPAAVTIRVHGVVQGVGFRPFVYRQAARLGLGGTVCNDSAGVLIEAEGPASAVRELARLVEHEPPPLARVRFVTSSAIRSSAAATKRSLRPSRG